LIDEEEQDQGPPRKSPTMGNLSPKVPPALKDEESGKVVEKKPFSILFRCA